MVPRISEFPEALLSLLSAFRSEDPARGDEELLGLAAQYAVEGELALGCAAQLEEQFAAIVGQGIHGVDEPHARGLVQVRAVGHVLQEHQHVAVEVGLGDERDKLLLGQGPSVRAVSTRVAPEP